MLLPPPLSLISESMSMHQIWNAAIMVHLTLLILQDI